ncbi:MAG: tRNA dihydrouridine synthase DusB [Myxococcota bacterium]
MLQIGRHQLSSPYILAPMAGVSEMPFRLLARSFGAALAPTELISAKGLTHGNARTLCYLLHDAQKERPFCVQLFGGTASVMAQAAQECVARGADIIDINMGCPVKKVTKTGSGSALLCDMERAFELVQAICQAVAGRAAVTAKLRAGWDADHINCVEMAQALQQAGCAAVALHARTRAQGYSGHADWNLIAQLKQAVTIPVIGNGDVTCVAHARAMQQQTGCDGVMIGRGAMGNPWIFEHLTQATGCGQPPSGPERLPVVLRHFREHIAFRKQVAAHEAKAGKSLTQEQIVVRAVRAFRNHLVWYSTGLTGASAFRQQVMQLHDVNALQQLVQQFFAAPQSPNSSVRETVEGIDYRQAFG